MQHLRSEQGPHVLIAKSKSNPVNGMANSTALTYKIEEGTCEPFITFPGQNAPSELRRGYQLPRNEIIGNRPRHPTCPLKPLGRWHDDVSHITRIEIIFL